MIMEKTVPHSGQTAAVELRPWYREPWPWVLIALPLLSVIGCGITLWLALSHPDYLVVKPQELDQIKTELRAQETPGQGTVKPAADTHDGDR